MRNGIIFLNTQETKWTVLKDGEKERIKLKYGDKDITRTIIYYKAYDTVVVFAISIEGTIAELPVGTTDITGLYE